MRNQPLQKAKKSFCFILPLFFKENKGGAELQCYYLAQELMKRGWQVHYIREYRHKNFPREYIKDGIKIYGIHGLRQEFRVLNTPFLYQIMNRIKADVWYCRATISYLHPVLKNARKLKCGKVVWACSHEKELIGVKTNKRITQLTWNFSEAIFKKALPKIDHILLQTNHQKKLLNKKFNLNGNVIYNAHPPPPTVPAPADIKKSQTIVWIGRLQTWKRPEKFIQLAKHFKKKPYLFIAIGKPLGVENHEMRLKKADETLCNFTYTGELENSTVCDIISNARLLVCTSDHEGFSNTFIEAWARGVPVISLRVNPDNLLTDKHLGCVSNSFEQLCKDIDLLMENNRLWSKISANCTQFFKTHLTIDKAVNKLEKEILI